MNQPIASLADGVVDGAPFHIRNAAAPGSLVLVCEHASNSVPSHLVGELASDEVLRSHAGWDPGALAVAERLSDQFASPLVSATVSRLVYDLNRPPESVDAIRTSSEVHEIPGNANLSPEARAERVTQIYHPFHDALSQVIRIQRGRAARIVLVTIHTFAPVYLGCARTTQIGILHDADHRVADAMLEAAPQFTELKVARNEPYSAADGVTHTLKKHALSDRLLNVMIEVRNDLVETKGQQEKIVEVLSGMLCAALDTLAVPYIFRGEGGASC